MTDKSDKEYIKQLEDHIEALEQGHFRSARPCCFEEMGECCCKCIYQRKIMGHPWVGATQGGKLFCYGCAAQETDTDPVGKMQIMLSHDHGCCELFTPKADTPPPESEKHREELAKDELDSALKGL